MSSIPLNQEEISQEISLPLRDAISACVDQLEPRKRYILESTFYGQKLSYRKLGLVMNLSKSQIHRLREEALEELKNLLVTAGIEP